MTPSSTTPRGRAMSAWPPWTVVRGLGKHPLFSSARVLLLVVPIVAGILEGLAGVSVNVQAPAQLRWAVASALLAVVASVVVEMCCPEPIKSFASKEAYAAAQLATYGNLAPNKRLAIIQTHVQDIGGSNVVGRTTDLQAKIAMGEALSAEEQKELDLIVRDYFAPAVQIYAFGEWQRLNVASCWLGRQLAVGLYAGSATIALLLFGRRLIVFFYGA